MITGNITTNLKINRGPSFQSLRVKTLLGAIMFVLLLGLVPSPAGAQEDRAFENHVRELSNEFRCPTCQGISVNDSQASFSVQIKDKVRKMLAEGQSDDDIKAYFVSRYGEWILRAPKKEGLGLVLWLLPFGGLLVVGGLVFYRMKISAKEEKIRATKEAETSLTPEQLHQVEADLKIFEEEE